MRRQIKKISPFMVFAGFALALLITSLGSMRASTLSSPQGDGVRRVTPAEVRDLLKNGKAVLVDVRGTPVYKAGHIKGALDIAVGDIAQRADELPKGKMILTYCS